MSGRPTERFPSYTDARLGVRVSLVLFLFLLLGLAGAFLIWANYATLNVSIRAFGEISPQGELRRIQNLEGGIVTEILVREGEWVEKGTILARIDPTVARADLQADHIQLLSIQAQIDRLEAILAGRAQLVFSEPPLTNQPGTGQPGAGQPETGQAEAAIAAVDVEQARSIREGEAALFAENNRQYRIREDSLQAQIEILTADTRLALSLMDNLKTRRALSAERVRLAEQQAADGVTSRKEVLEQRQQAADLAREHLTLVGRLEKNRAQHADLEAQLARLRSDRQAEAQQVHNGLIATRATLLERLSVHQDRLGRREVRSPVYGKIQRLFVTTSGAVLQPGQALLEIVPLGEDLLLRARIPPKDIGFLYPGQEVNVYLTAYDASIYGGMIGELIRLSDDTFLDEASGGTYYLAEVRLTGSRLPDLARDLPILPGMTAQIDIKTGERTLFSYLLKPIFKLRTQALQER